MTYADLVLHLIERLQQKEKELNQAIELIQKYNLQSKDEEQDEAS